MFLTPWLLSMKSTLRTKSRRTRSFRPQRRTRRPNPEAAVAPQAELLEERTLLAISSAFIPATNTLLVESDGSDAIVITAIGSVLINGNPPDDGPLDPAIVNGILVKGGPEANNIDLSGVLAGGLFPFSNLPNNGITVNGDDGADTITASEIGGFYNGNNGDDQIFGNPATGASITVNAGNGEDFVVGGLGDDVILGDDGGDTINGGDGNDFIDGGDGQDFLLGDTSTDTAGDDTIDGGEGADSIFGDIFDTAADSVGGADSLLGSSGDDLMFGGGGPDTMHGGADDDTLVAGFGNDLVRGQGGNDLMLGGESEDRNGNGVLDPGEDTNGNGMLDGDDTMRNDGEDTLFGQEGDDTINGGTGNDSITGADGNDQLNGNDGQDFLNGNNGNDTIDGGNDEDRILGGSGSDSLFGSFDDDTLRGQGDNDYLNGGAGADRLDGGTGNDTLDAYTEQVVFLDFISAFDPGEHLYLNEDLNENGILDFGEDSNGNGILDNDPEFIKMLLEADYSNYEVTFTRFQPTSGDFVTIVFNDDPTVLGTTFPEMPFLGIGEASEFDFRNTALDGTALVDLNDFLGPLTAGDPVPVQRAKFNFASAYVAGHELGNLMGLRNADAFGPLGINPATGQPFGLPVDPGTESGFDVTPEDFTPIFPGPGQPGAGDGDAVESIFHIMTAPTALETLLNDGVIDLNDPARNPFFSERSAIKLAFADTGNLEREQRPDEVDPSYFGNLKTFANPQPLTLRNLSTPNSLVFGRNTAFEYDVQATAVWDGIILRPTGNQDPHVPMRDFERSEDDYYSFNANPGDVIEINVYSELLRRFIEESPDPLNADTIIRVLDANGRPLNWFPGRTPGFGQQHLIRTDSSVNDRFNDNSVDVPVGSGNFFAAPDQDPVILTLQIPVGTVGPYRVMVAEPYQRGIFAIPINEDIIPGPGFMESGDVVELDPITGVELNRIDVDTITGVTTTSLPGTLGGASVAFDPVSNTLFYVNPTRSNFLFHLDPDTGAINAMFDLTAPGGFAAGVLPGLHGMALLNPDNLLFVDVVNDDLYRVSPNGMVLDMMDIDNISENLLGDGGPPALVGANGQGQPALNAERSTWENFSPGTANPEPAPPFFGDTTFFPLAPFGGPFDGGSVGGQYQLTEGKAHDPGATPIPLPNQSPYMIGFDRTSQGNPDDIDIRFDMQITGVTGKSEGMAVVLGETGTYGITGAGPGLPGNFGNGGIEPGSVGFNANFFAFVIDSRDNDAAGPDLEDTVSLVLNGAVLGEFTDPLDDGALHNIRVLIQARDTSGQPILGGGNVGATGTEITYFIDGVQRETVFVGGPDGQEYTTAVGESRVFFYSDVDGTTNFANNIIDNVRVDFRVPLVRNVTPGLAVARQIPNVAGGLFGTNTELVRALILDEDDQGNQIVHEISPFTTLPGITVTNTGAVTSTFAPNTPQAQAPSLFQTGFYGAIGVHHLHNNGFTETGLPVGTQVYLGTGINTPFGIGQQVHAFNRGGDDPLGPGGFNEPFTRFTQSLGVTTTWDSTAAPAFGALNPDSLLDGTTGGVASNPAFFLTPERNPGYNLKDFGADDALGAFVNGLPDRVDFGNYEMFIYRYATGPAAVDNGVGNTLIGGSGDDVILGSSGNDSIRGNGGNDTIDGRAGKDSIHGGSNNDIIHGGNGDDTIDGGNGVDEIFGDAGDDEVIFDPLSGSDGTIEGGPGTDIMRIVTASKNDTVRLQANGSKMKITVSAPNQNPVTLSSQVLEVLVVETNLGNDRVFIEDLNGVVRLQEIRVDLGGGADLLDASLQLDTDIRLSAMGQNGADTILGGSGRDSLNGGNSGDSIVGGPGRDTLDGGGGGDRLFGGDDNDFILGGDNRDHLFGDAGNDTLNGNAGDDNLFGGTGADSLRGELGADSIEGDDGNDTMLGDDGDDTLRGGRGADTGFGGDGVDSLDGGDDNDTLSGGEDDDTLVGGEGNDSLFGDNHDDLLNGNAGDDTLSGGNGDDQLLGGAGQDDMDGDFGDDTLSGNSGRDSIRGGDGQDVLRGGTDNDTLNGGDGFDTLLGEDGDDGLSGHDGGDVLNGGAGVDTLIGGDGDDMLRGGANGDFLVGNNGSDDLDGQGATDTLSGGQGFDTLTGVPDDVVDESIEAFFDPAKPEFAWINQV